MLKVKDIIYEPVKHHWFYKTETETRVVWYPFCMNDSKALEEAYASKDITPDTLVATDGGRYDVNITSRERISVYWESEPTAVKRCSWFHKGKTDGRYLPYDEDMAAKLEDEYKKAFMNGTWNHKVVLLNGETVVFHGPDVLVLLPQTQMPDAWGNTPVTYFTYFTYFQTG